MQITKHILKINGVQIFCGLLTVTNEKGEIRVCTLVATKAHSQFELALKRMRQSLDQFGHSQPVLFYTDNMSDKTFLESSFPSLHQDVVPVEKYAHLELLSVPPDVRVLVRNTVSSIDDAVRTIMEGIEPDGHNTIYVGFDSEWNVNVSERGFVMGRGQTAIIQIAHQKIVYIFQVCINYFVTANC
jgi:hypothetical protein